MRFLRLSAAPALGLLLLTLLFLAPEWGNASSHREFEQPSIDAVLQWKFEPGVKDGRAVKTRMMLPLKFNLNN